MRKILIFILTPLIAVVLIISCKKEFSCENCGSSPGDKPPIAIAKPDTTIVLPLDSVLLNGSTSYDQDGTISNYNWTKISGPSSFVIVNSTSKQTIAKNLVPGSYQFELKVTDNGGLSAKDTARIVVASLACDNSNRPQVPAQLIPIGNLSVARFNISVTSLGNKIFFAGGHIRDSPMEVHSSRVDIYDVINNTWDTAHLCIARSGSAAISSGTKVFFAGGETQDGTAPVDSVDIYNASTNSWTVQHLSCAGLGIVAAAINNKVLFAGGDAGFNITPGINRSTTVDIYDLNLNSWTTASLSEIREMGHAAVSDGSKVWIAGGQTPGANSHASKTIDVYNDGNNSWTTDTMIESKVDFAAAFVNGKIYWAGGATGDIPNRHVSCLVEARNVSLPGSNTMQLFKPAIWGIDDGDNVVVRGNYMVFLRNYPPDNNRFDIYDLSTNVWKIGVLSQPIPEDAAFICVNNVIYIAGGITNGNFSNASSQVYRLDF